MDLCLKGEPELHCGVKNLFKGHFFLKVFFQLVLKSAGLGDGPGPKVTSSRQQSQGSSPGIKTLPKVNSCEHVQQDPVGKAQFGASPEPSAGCSA